MVSASQRTDMALSELYCFANPSSYVLRMSVVGCFIKCIWEAVYAKNLILGLCLCNLNCLSLGGKGEVLHSGRVG